MSKMPYIKLYIGDFLQDTDDLSREAEYAWFRVIMKMHQNDQSGFYTATVKGLKTLWKCESNSEVMEIITELKFHNTGNIVINGSVVEFTNRRMVREKEVSEVRAKSGQKGGKSKQANVKQNPSKTLANDVAKTKQNPDYDYGNDNDYDYEEKGGVGEKTGLHDFLDEACEYFGVNQLRNPRAYMDMNAFLKHNHSQIDYVKKQFEFYFKIKELEKASGKSPKICNLHTWIQGKWNENDYEKMYNLTKPSNGNQKTVSTTIGGFKS
jgi:hypothetical protein